MLICVVYNKVLGILKHTIGVVLHLTTIIYKNSKGKHNKTTWNNQQYWIDLLKKKERKQACTHVDQTTLLPFEIIPTYKCCTTLKMIGVNNINGKGSSIWLWSTWVQSRFLHVFIKSVVCFHFCQVFFLSCWFFVVPANIIHSWIVL